MAGGDKIAPTDVGLDDRSIEIDDLGVEVMDIGVNWPDEGRARVFLVRRRI